MEVTREHLVGFELALELMGEVNTWECHREGLIDLITQAKAAPITQAPKEAK